MSKIEKLKKVLEFDARSERNIIDLVETGRITVISKEDLAVAYARYGAYEYVLRLLKDEKHLNNLYKIITEDK